MLRIKLKHDNFQRSFRILNENDKCEKPIRYISFCKSWHIILIHLYAAYDTTSYYAFIILCIFFLTHRSSFFLACKTVENEPLI